MTASQGLASNGQSNGHACPAHGAHPTLTTANGAPIAVQQALTAGPRGPVLMQDVALLEQMQHFNRERIPERVVHAKGSGAYGTFTVTGRLEAPADWVLQAVTFK